MGRTAEGVRPQGPGTRSKMRGRKSSRGAAVVLAGCVGLAVMAPGLAVAGPLVPPTSNAGCLLADPTTPYYDASSGNCVAANPAATSDSTSSSTGSTAGGTSTSTSTTTTTPTTTTPDAGLSGVTTPPLPEVAGGTATADGETAASGTPAASAATQPITLSTRSARTAESRLQAALVEDVPVVDPAALVPIKLPTGLPFVIPTEVPTGGFTNAQEACGFFVSQLTAATPEEAAALGAAAAQFCGSLPTSFTGLDPTQLVQDLLDIINGLI